MIIFEKLRDPLSKKLEETLNQSKEDILKNRLDLPVPVNRLTKFGLLFNLSRTESTTGETVGGLVIRDGGKVSQFLFWYDL